MKALLQVDFSAPPKPQASSAGIPLISLTASVNSAGGTLGGDQALYYAASAVDASGNESRLSFIVRATIPSGSNTNSVTLTGLSFSGNTTAFHVYRSIDPYRLLRIALAVPISDQFVDTGATADLQSPPDENYDHANFYWRLELQPETIATIHSTTTIGNDDLQVTANEYRGAVVRITSGRGKGQERAVLTNTATALTVAPAWIVPPDETSRYVVAESGWRFGALAYSSPVQFEVPNREGATVHVSGRAANVNDKECAYELSPLTRWNIGGSPGPALDGDVPPEPAFALARTGKGTVELMGVGFAELTNTRSIAAGTLTLYYWDEVGGSPPIGLASAIGESDVLVDLSATGDGVPGDALHVDNEVMVIEEALNGGSRYRVERAALGSTAAAHDSGALVYRLARKITVVAFPRDFFGSPASGDFSHPIVIPDARLAAAQFFVTNSRGNSPAAARCLTSTVDHGVRTLAGGQLSLQIDGYLAIQAGAVPPLMIDTSRRAGDVSAIVREAPIGGAVELRIKQNGADWCALTIAEGATASAYIDGFFLPVLEAQAQLTLDVVSVGSSLPGRDLTVTIRL